MCTDGHNRCQKKEDSDQNGKNYSLEAKDYPVFQEIQEKSQNRENGAKYNEKVSLN